MSCKEQASMLGKKVGQSRIIEVSEIRGVREVSQIGRLTLHVIK